MKNYVIGLDYGTLSCRCVLVDAENGTTLAEDTAEYSHGVMSEALPNGQKLPENFALQHPQDYLDVLSKTVHAVMEKSGIPTSAVKGLGIDFTACTILPVNQDGTPLCLLEEYQDNPHAYVKLWKHHAAQPEADEITNLAAERNEPWLPIFGGKISSEFELPKILQVLHEAPDIYENTSRFMEAGDWLSTLLTGKESRSITFAGFKGLWNHQLGYPSNEYLVALDKRLDGLFGTKMPKEVMSIDKKAGNLNEYGASLTGLPIGLPIALSVIDAHSAMPALNIVDDGDLMLIVGTSTCHLLNSKKQKQIDGINAYVKSGVIPGLFTYEAGQAAVGDIFDWFVKNQVPATYQREAEEQQISIHKLLRNKAKNLKVGESGLIALDWLNGNRSILVNSNLSGLVLGLNLGTKPEEIYRAWIEATAYGTKMIIDQFEENGVKINSICAAGGIAQKDEMMMQIYADVLNRDIRIAGSTQACALGSAIYGAVAGGLYPTVKVAAEKMSLPDQKVYHPIKANHQTYAVLYREYKKLHDYFGRGENKVMELLSKKDYR